MYDPCGNVVEIRDDAYQTVFFQNQSVAPRSLYEYDALYRLITASGRERRALRGAPAIPDSASLDLDFPVKRGDPNALRNCTQTFSYDAVGNIERLHHQAGIGTWTRRLRYADDSNRLIASWDTDDDWQGINPLLVTRYDFDTHGNMLNLARSAASFNLRLDYRDMVCSIDLGGGGRVHYQYDAGKQRTRKRVLNQKGRGGYWERICLEGYELYRRYGGNGAAPVEEIETNHVTDSGQRLLIVDDVITSGGAANPRPDDRPVKAQTLFRYQYGNHLGSACLGLDRRRRSSRTRSTTPTAPVPIVR